MVSYPGTINGDQTVTGNQTVQGNQTVAGALNLTPGAAINLGPDVDLYRAAPNVLQTDDSFTALGGTAKDLNAGLAGGGVAVKEGSNCRMGTLVLTGATPVVVANTSVTATTRIFLTANTPGGTPGHFWVSARSAGTSFSVTGTAGDTSTLAYLLVEPS